MLKQVLIIANPASGKGLAQEYADKLRQVIEEVYQAQVEVRSTEGLGDAIRWSKSAMDNGFDTVLCLGGDGTVNETVQGLMLAEERPYFGFVPLGTVNDLGRALGYDMNPDCAIEQYRNVQTVPLDIASVNDRYFMNVLAIGSIPEAVMNTDSDDKNKLGFLAYVKDAVGKVLGDNSYHLEIEDSQGNVTQLETDLLIAGLTNSVGGYEEMFSFADYDDGLLHLAAVKGSSLVDYAKVALEGGVQEEGETDNLFVLSDHAMKIRSLNAEDEIASNIDGDEGPTLPLELMVIKHALKVIVPKEQ